MCDALNEAKMDKFSSDKHIKVLNHMAQQSSAVFHVILHIVR